MCTTYSSLSGNQEWQIPQVQPLLLERPPTPAFRWKRPLLVLRSSGELGGSSSSEEDEDDSDILVTGGGGSSSDGSCFGVSGAAAGFLVESSLGFWCWCVCCAKGETNGKELFGLASVHSQLGHKGSQNGKLRQGAKNIVIFYPLKDKNLMVSLPTQPPITSREPHLQVLQHRPLLGKEKGAVGTLEDAHSLVEQMLVEVGGQQRLMGEDGVTHGAFVDHPVGATGGQLHSKPGRRWGGKEGAGRCHCLG